MLNTNLGFECNNLTKSSQSCKDITQTYYFVLYILFHR